MTSDDIFAHIVEYYLDINKQHQFDRNQKICSNLNGFDFKMIAVVAELIIIGTNSMAVNDFAFTNPNFFCH